MPVVIGNVDYVCCHLRYGHYELDLTDSELESFNSMDRSGQERYIREKGDFLVDDVAIDDIGDIVDVIIYE